MMMYRTIDLGPFAGPIFATILVVECLFFLFLEWWIPREDLDYVPTSWDISSYKHPHVVRDSFAARMTRASLFYSPLRERQTIARRCIQSLRSAPHELEYMLCQMDTIPLNPVKRMDLHVLVSRDRPMYQRPIQSGLFRRDRITCCTRRYQTSDPLPTAPSLAVHCPRRICLIWPARCAIHSLSELFPFRSSSSSRRPSSTRV
jgi:hypothetical protein